MERVVAWNEVPAKDDEHLSIGAYYVRLNALRAFLSPLSVQMFDIGWNVASSSDMKNLHRSALVGMVLADLIRAFSFEEITQAEIPVGSWFVHSGETVYSNYREGRATASIILPDGRTLKSIVRSDCQFTASAIGNMADVDDVSFVVGRRIAAEKFDLVGAGYREALATLRQGRTIELSPSGHLLDRGWDASLLPKVLPSVDVGIPDDRLLALAVKDTAEFFASAVRDQGAWRMLYGDDGRPAHETRHQSLFRMFSQLTFAALGIGIHPGADHGRGPTDLTLVLRDAVHIVEFKKDTNQSHVLHGLQVQLPLYMQSAGTEMGTYVVLCHSKTDAEATELLRGHLPVGLAIQTFVVDCRPQKSASKA
jgi:hypothetical protein